MTTTRDALLQMLARTPGGWISGEAAGAELGVSRAAVGKAVAVLRAEGHLIAARKNRGYRLEPGGDVLSAEGLLERLGSVRPAVRPAVLGRVGSTNTLLARMAREGAPEGTLLAAREQTQGRGCRGRPFYSPGGTGLYMSLLLRPEGRTGDFAPRLTAAAAVAACDAIDAVFGARARIKWPNDLFVRGRKVGGILTEGASDPETGRLEFAVIGAGFNLYPPENRFPGDLGRTAGPICRTPRPDGKNRLAAAFVRRLLELLPAADAPECAALYRERCLLVGREVALLSAAGRVDAVVTGVDDALRLVVRREDGSEAALAPGDASVCLRSPA